MPRVGEAQGILEWEPMMSIHGNGVPGAGPDHFEDEFGSYLECAKQNPVFGLHTKVPRSATASSISW